jgi:quinoprotein glucose dehydrogenase
MGPYYIPPSPATGGQHHCSWYAPGAAGGVNIDSGAAFDPETGMMYVGAQSGLSTIEVAKDPCSELDYTQYPGNMRNCGRPGALPRPEGWNAPPRPPTVASRIDTGQNSISILKPRELGGITAYDMNTGDRKWWIPNGGRMVTPTTNDPLFAGVTLPPQPAGGGQAQVMNTKTLVIYGTGRSGGPPGPPFHIYAVDKMTGRQVGAVQIPSRTTAVPMTFMHMGRQYIVFATGAGENTSLVALSLPRGARRPTNSGGPGN